MATKPELLERLQTLNADIKTVKKEREDVEQALIALNPRLFVIFATPDNRHYVKHIVCICTSKRRAEEITGRHKSTRDYDNAVTWTYTIETMHFQEVPEEYFSTLDLQPEDFPYT